jgi:peptidyl-prolyl cis-trans isomerase B (cyclophilin B)
MEINMKKLTALILTAVLLVGACFSLASCGVKKDYCEYYADRDNSGRNVYYVKLEVESYGDIVLLLDSAAAPFTVINFLSLVGEGFYDGRTFHRVAENFMIQGGCPNGDGTGDAGSTIYGEFSANGHLTNDLTHKRGVLSMARSSNSYDSASCQFFICNADSEFLDGNYAAFGYVIYGMYTVDAITEATVGFANPSSGTISNKSKQAKISRATIITEAEAAEYIALRDQRT